MTGRPCIMAGTKSRVDCDVSCLSRAAERPRTSQSTPWSVAGQVDPRREPLDAGTAGEVHGPEAALTVGVPDVVVRRVVRRSGHRERAGLRARLRGEDRLVEVRDLARVGR